MHFFPKRVIQFESNDIQIYCIRINQKNYIKVHKIINGFLFDSPKK